MLNIRVWNLESDREAKVVRFLENTFLRFRQLEYLAIRTAGRSALRKCHRKGAPLRESLRRAIQHYLAQDNYIIFLIGADQRKSSPLVDELGWVIKKYDFLIEYFSHRRFKKANFPRLRNGRALFRVSTPRLKTTVNGLGRSGIKPWRTFMMRSLTHQRRK